MRGYSKPPAGSRLDYGHPLCPDVFCALLNEGAGSVTMDLVNGRRGVISGGIWGSGNDGVILSHTNTTDKVDWGTDIFLPRQQTTVVLQFKKRDTTNRVSGLWGSSNAGTPRFGAHMPFSDGNIYWDAGNASSGRLTLGSQSFQKNSIWVLTSGPRGRDIWQDGVMKGSATGETLSSFTVGGGNYTLGNYDGQASDLVDYSFNYIFRRQLSASEIAMISADPYAGIMAPLYRKFFVPPATPPDPSAWAVPAEQPYLVRTGVLSGS